MHKLVKFKRPLVSWLSALLSFNSYNSGNFHPNNKNKMSKSKLPPSRLPKTKNISEIKQKGFCSIVDQTQDLVIGTPGR